VAVGAGLALEAVAASRGRAGIGISA
jgi:hypothetical protein